MHISTIKLTPEYNVSSDTIPCINVYKKYHTHHIPKKRHSDSESLLLMV